MSVGDYDGKVFLDIEGSESVPIFAFSGSRAGSFMVRSRNEWLRDRINTYRREPGRLRENDAAPTNLVDMRWPLPLGCFAIPLVAALMGLAVHG